MTNAQPNSAENPFPVRAVAIRVAGWIDKLGTVWVEGQLTQINLRNDSKTVFMVLRDPAANMSLTVTCPRDLVLSAPVKLTEGTQVVVCGKPTFYTVRGSFSLRLSEIRAVGMGELLARIERLRRLLEAEGLFDPRLKRPLPFLPSTIGLITGRASAAGHLALAFAPDPDLLIRTGGEQRVSNFLLWQCAYSELFFTHTLWPDFDAAAFDAALAWYATRERRFGLVNGQLPLAAEEASA